jgi:uncharacterized repeat protein (TIGR03803 family)
MSIQRPALTIGRTLLTGMILISTPGAMAQTPSPTLTTLYRFSGGSDGSAPYGDVVSGADGVLYGTTFSGGTGTSCLTYVGYPGCGIVFSLTPPESPGGEWTEAVLYTFTGGSDGANPEAGLVIGDGGVLYGTTSAGGILNEGTVFCLTPPTNASGSWTETVLHSFTGYPNDGTYPYAGVVAGGGGVLYGTTYSGGSVGYGVVFSLTPPTSAGGSWTEAVLHSFSYIDGAHTSEGLVIGSGGVLYGTSYYGGSSNGGVVFSLAPPTSPGGAWTETVLYNFTDEPSSRVVVGRGGMLFGATSGGGASSGGTIFSLIPPGTSGGPWTEITLHSFLVQTGFFTVSPSAVALASKTGALYGTTFSGGASHDGTAYSLRPPATAGASWTYSLLQTFTGGDDGANPNAGLIFGKGGVLYGTTEYGGVSGFGTVFSLEP